MDELEFYNGSLTGSEIDKRIVLINCGMITAASTTITNANITAKHVVLRAIIGTPTALGGNLTVTTSDGSMTITGTINGGTTLSLVLGIPL